jgi:hypothetical protein
MLNQAPSAYNVELFYLSCILLTPVSDTNLPFLLLSTST